LLREARKLKPENQRLRMMLMVSRRTEGEHGGLKKAEREVRRAERAAGKAKAKAAKSEAKRAGVDEPPTSNAATAFGMRFSAPGR